MSDLRQSLGVFEPATEDITSQATRCAEQPTTEPVTPTNPPPPLSAARRAELDALTLADYNNMTIPELHAEMQQRNIRFHKFHRKTYCVSQLQYSDRVDRDVYQKWKTRTTWELTPDDEIKLPLELLPGPNMPWYKVDRILKLLSSRQDLVFASSFHEDITRKSFLHLPLEIRQMVYAFALDMSPMLQVKCSYAEDQDRFAPINASGQSTSFFQTIYTLQTLAAMSKAMRWDVRSFFYGSLEICLLNDDAGAAGHFGISQKFLLKLGPEGVASLPRLKIILSKQPLNEDTSHARVAFQAFLRSLSMCHSLRLLHLDLTVSHIFWSNIEALKASFLWGEALKSSGLEELAEAIASLPNLDTVHVRLLPQVHTSKDNDFLIFAFSGIRQFILWTEITNRLITNNVSIVRQGTDSRGLSGITVDVQYQHISVYKNEDRIMNFRHWKIERSGR
ncbi:hypothetical protein ST47_g8358 [Ascochyta rabiei]|uniref:Uncharacterized protein n=2 Tax=Didymella rabiei TaxID=5454 RepID=A0A162ZA66_DIDRA|nr:hypothetical protein ST47_g8358 [Ascochyta rabiei]